MLLSNFTERLGTRLSEHVSRLTIIHCYSKNQRWGVCMSEVKLVCNLICRDDVPTHVLPNTRTVLSTLQNREENSAAAHMYTADTITSYCSSNNTVTVMSIHCCPRPLTRKHQSALCRFWTSSVDDGWDVPSMP